MPAGQKVARKCFTSPGRAGRWQGNCPPPRGHRQYPGAVRAPGAAPAPSCSQRPWGFPPGLFSPLLPALHSRTNLLPLPCCVLPSDRGFGGKQTEKIDRQEEPSGGGKLHKGKPNELETSGKARLCQVSAKTISNNQVLCIQGIKVPCREMSLHHSLPQRDWEKDFFPVLLRGLTFP